MSGFKIVETSAFGAEDIGIAVVRGNQTFELVGVERGRSRTGKAVTKLVWRSGCARCGAVYETKSLRIFRSLTRRCPACVPARTPRR